MVVCMFLLVSTSIPLEFVTVELEGVPWWTLLSYDVMDSIPSYFHCNCNELLSELTSCSTDSIHSILLLAGYHSEKEKR